MKNYFLKNKYIFIFLLTTLLFFGALIKINYSVDTYLLLGSPDLSYIQEYSSNGRIITTLMFKIFQFLRFNFNAMYLGSYLIGIICVTFSIYELFKILSKYLKNKIITALLSILIIINPFIIELWLFIEHGIMMLSILSCILAYKYFDSYIVTKDYKKIIYSLIFLTIALFSYQGTIAIFVSLSCLSIIWSSKSIKEFIKNNLICFGCYIIPTIINYFIVLQSQNNRVGFEINSLPETLKFIVNASINQLFNAFGILPSNLFRITLIIILFLALITIFTRIRKKETAILELLYIILIVYIFTIAPIIPQNIKTVVMFPRTTYVFGSIIGIILLYLFKYYNNKIIKSCIIFLSIFILTTELISFNNIAINRYKTNNKDKHIIVQIENEINKYEQSTGITVTKLALYNLDNATKFYPEVNDTLNVSAISEENSNKCMLSFYMKRKIELTNQDNSIYYSHFKGKKWKTFDTSQIVIKDDTLHWYIY